MLLLHFVWLHRPHTSQVGKLLLLLLQIIVYCPPPGRHYLSVYPVIYISMPSSDISLKTSLYCDIFNLMLSLLDQHMMSYSCTVFYSTTVLHYSYVHSIQTTEQFCLFASLYNCQHSTALTHFECKKTSTRKGYKNFVKIICITVLYL